MAAEKNDAKGNGLQIFLVVLVVVSMGMNVYLLRHYTGQDDSIEVMTSLADENKQIHEELTSITTTLADLATRQTTQEASTATVLETLTLIDARQANKDAEPVVEPNVVDKESWATANAEVQEVLTSITTILADLAARQTTQEASTTTVLETLTQIDARQASKDAEPVVEPNVVDKESWATANTEVQETLTSITTTLADLAARQTTQDASTASVLETLAQIDARQAVEEEKPVEAPSVEPSWVDKEAWAAGNKEIGEELSAIKALLGEIMTEVAGQNGVSDRTEAREEPKLEIETESDYSIQAMASAAELTYEHDVDQPSPQISGTNELTCPVVEVRLLPGDSVWSIVARLKPSPRPALVNEVVEYNGITDPRRLPVGFPVRVPMDLVNGD
ncbi:MAG: hypothetical protein M0R49_04675 [Limnochordia bacterium]|nr:hypothetical protein [Limnochordia bacterium]